MYVLTWAVLITMARGKTTARIDAAALRFVAEKLVMLGAVSINVFESILCVWERYCIFAIFKEKFDVCKWLCHIAVITLC